MEKMTRDEARKTVRSSWRQLITDITTPAKKNMNGETSYICPLCGHGKNGDGMTYNPKSDDGNGLICFGCGFSGDILSLYQQTQGGTFPENLSLLAGKLGIEIETTDYIAGQKKRAASRKNDDFTREGNIRTPPERKNAHAPAQSVTDYTDYYAECLLRIEAPEAIEYLNRRGISLETAVSHNIGYDPEADPGKSGHKARRIIIPISKGYFIGRAIDEKSMRYANVKDSTAGIFNAEALHCNEVRRVFIVEGAFDALSIAEAGESAAALNSTSNIGKLIDELQAVAKERGNAAKLPALILCLDNDKAGDRAADKLTEELKRLNISFTRADDICNGHKDPNEALTADREQFINACKLAAARAAKPNNAAIYMDYFMKDDIARFGDVIPTGFAELDSKTGGGLYAGLYALAATSSLGKTTFALQMADQIALAGNDVIFFSLEQSALELVTKSIARTAAQIGKKDALSSMELRRGKYNRTTQQAAQIYRETIAERVNIVEGNFNCNISFIGEYVRNYINANGTRPVIIIDYLQILQSAETRPQTLKEVMDSSVTELKRLSREQNIPVIAISSVNRSNYLTPIDFESLKESGGIEYTCDVVLGLQLQCLNDDMFTKQNNIAERRKKIKEEKARSPRQIELVCLKNRYGIASFNCLYDYIPEHDLFTERAGVETDEYAPKKANRRL